MKSCFVASLAFLVPLLVYCQTLAPGLTLEDSAEYASVAKVLGLAHPPGSPTWVLLAHTMNYVPFGSFVQRTNFLSALSVSIAALFLFLLVRDQIKRWDIALGAAWTAAFSQCVWGQAVVTYNYGLNLMMIVLVLWLIGRWRIDKHPYWLAATAFAGGLGTGVHHLFILMGPVFLFWIFWGRRREALRSEIVGLSVVSFLLGLTVLLYLPIRSAQNPPIAWGEIHSLGSFLDYFSRKVYKEAEGGIWYAGKLEDSVRFLLAFVLGFFREQGGLLALFSLPGMRFVWRVNRPFAMALGGIILLNGPVLLLMGGSQYTPTSEYINRLYYLPATTALAVFIVAGWRQGFSWLAEFWGRSAPKVPMVTALTLSAALFPLALNWNKCDKSDYGLAQEYADNLMLSIPPGGAVFPLTNNESFLLLSKRFIEEDKRAILMDKRFGWDGTSPTGGLFTAWDVGEGAPNELLPLFQGLSTVPHNLLYRSQPSPAPEGLERFRGMQDIPYRITTLPRDYPFLSPFERMIFASYCAYYAGLGTNHHLEGDSEARDQAWSRAEALNPGDAYCHYLLGWVYENSTGRPSSDVLRHYEQALELFDSIYDPLDTRFYGVTKKEIQRSLERVAKSPPGSSSH